METLKREAADIGQKVEETDKVIAEIETVSHQYLPLSTACSNIYFTMDSLNQIHFLYQYSLRMFLDIFSTVLSRDNPALNGKSDYGLRLKIITSDLFAVVYDRVARGMLHADRLTLAILLCRIHLKGTAEQNLDAEFNFFLRSREGLIGNTLQIDGLTHEQIEGTNRLANRLPIFKKMIERIKSMPEFSAWLNQSSPEQNVPQLWDESKALSPIVAAMHRLLLIQAFRADRVIAAGQLFVSTVLGEEFMPLAEKELDFAACVEKQLTSNTPALLCSVPGKGLTPIYISHRNMKKKTHENR